MYGLVAACLGSTPGVTQFDTWAFSDVPGVSWLNHFYHRESEYSKTGYVNMKYGLQYSPWSMSEGGRAPRPWSPSFGLRTVYRIDVLLQVQSNLILWALASVPRRGILITAITGLSILSDDRELNSANGAFVGAKKEWSDGKVSGETAPARLFPFFGASEGSLSRRQLSFLN